MSDLPGLHARATKLILALRAGLGRLESIEVWHSHAAALHNKDSKYILEAVWTAAVYLTVMTLLLQHGEGPGDPVVLARDLHQKLAELQVCAVQ